MEKKGEDAVVLIYKWWLAICANHFLLFNNCANNIHTLFDGDE